MKNPGGQTRETRGERGQRRSANGDNGGKPMGVRVGTFPGAATAHADAGDKDAISVEGVQFEERVQKYIEIFNWPSRQVLRALGTNDGHGKFQSLRDHLGKDRRVDLREIGSFF